MFRQQNLTARSFSDPLRSAVPGSDTLFACDDGSGALDGSGVGNIQNLGLILGLLLIEESGGV